MNEFFISLQQSLIFLPKFIQECLIREGFDDISSFRSLKTDQFQDFISVVESQIKRLIRSAVDDTNLIAIEARDHFERTHDNYDLDEYKLPLGFKLKLQSIHDFCISQWETQLKNVQVGAKSTKKLNENNYQTKIKGHQKFTEISINKHEKHLKKVFNKLVKDEYKLGEEDILVIETNGESCTVECPLCPKIIETFESTRSQFNVSNFKAHVENKHAELSIFNRSDHLNEQTNETFSSIIVCNKELSPTRPIIDLNVSGPSNLLPVNNVANKAPKRKINMVTNSPRRTRQKLNHNDHFPALLKMLLENCKDIIDRNTGNRYNEEIKELASYFYIRFGLKQYEFLSSNLNLPHVSSVRKHLNKSMRNLKESNLDFDGLKKYLKKNNYHMIVGLFEDGTKVVEKVEYDRDSNCLRGLVSQIQRNGMPLVDNYKATTVQEIMHAINNNNKASYIQVLMIQPNSIGAQPFLLGYYGTDNRFTSKDVSNRNKYIFEQLKLRGIRLICCGSDGDIRMLAAQKRAIDYGIFTQFGPIKLCGNLDSQFYGNQDMLHVLKRMKNTLFSLSNPLIIGKYCATVNHLVIMVKMLPKHLHNLVPTDLDVTDKMDYRSIDKILDERVFETLKLMEKTDGTVAYLQLMKKLRSALIDFGVETYDRIKNLSYAVHFIRIWKQWQVNNRINKNYFISLNCWEAIEIDLIMLIGLSLESLEQNINMLSSQVCEQMFRTVRSFTTTESTIVNMTVKTFESRVNHMNYANYIMHKFKDQLKFPRLETSDKHHQRPKTNITYEQIIEATGKGMAEAENECKILGMTVTEIKIWNFLKPSKCSEEILEEQELNEQETLEHENISNDNTQEMSYSFYDFEFSPKTSNDGFLVATKGPIEKIHKCQFLEMITKDRNKVSSDIRYRFHGKGSLTFQQNATNESEFWKENMINKGDHIVLLISKQILCGNALDFKVLGEKTKIKSMYFKDFVQLTNSTKIGVLLEPIYEIKMNQKIALNNNFDYFDVGSYICHYQHDLNFDCPNNMDLLKSFL